MGFDGELKAVDSRGFCWLAWKEYEGEDGGDGGVSGWR